MYKYSWIFVQCHGIIFLPLFHILDLTNSEHCPYLWRKSCINSLSVGLFNDTSMQKKKTKLWVKKFLNSCRNTFLFFYFIFFIFIFLQEPMVYNIRFNTAKKHKLKDQAARQKHYVQTLFELELHIICLKVAVQCSKMCYLLESYQRLLESALHSPAVPCFCHWFFQSLTHNEKWGERIFDVCIG